MLRDALGAPVREVRVRAAIALDDVGSSPAALIEILADGLKSEDAIICYNAACYLGRLEVGAATALPALREMIERRNETDGKIIRPVQAAQIAIRRIEGTEQRGADEALDAPI